MVAIDGAVLAAWISGSAAVAAAFVTGVITHVLRKFDRSNSEQHAVNTERLDTHLEHVMKKLDDVHADTTNTRQALHEHISWHAHDHIEA